MNDKKLNIFNTGLNRSNEIDFSLTTILLIIFISVKVYFEKSDILYSIMTFSIPFFTYAAFLLIRYYFAYQKLKKIKKINEIAVESNAKILNVRMKPYKRYHYAFIEYKINGIDETFKTWIRLYYNRSNFYDTIVKGGELKVYYNPTNLSENFLEIENQFYLCEPSEKLFIHTKIFTYSQHVNTKCILDKDPKTAKELYVIRGKYKIVAAFVVLELIFAAAIIALFKLYSAFPEISSRLYLMIILCLIVTIIFVWGYEYIKKFNKKYADIFDIYKNGKFVKAKVLAFNGLETLVIDTTNRIQVLYEFVDSSGKSHVRLTDKVHFSKSLFSMKKGDLIDVFYDTSNPSKNFWPYE